MQHGEGKKWYLEAKNYSEDLLSDINRRKFIEEFFTETDKLKAYNKRLERFDNAPGFIRSLIRWQIGRVLKKKHHGQVIPLEDVEKVFGLTNSIIRTSCLCRTITTGKEKRYCYGVSMGPNGGKIGEIMLGIDSNFFAGPDAKGLETLSSEEALVQFQEHEREGLCHTVWTFVTPFIAGFCNCDRPDCLAMKGTVTHGLPVLYRAEYVARVDRESCTGCRRCMRVCQFGAIAYSAGTKKVLIDQKRCFGCGICRTACEKKSITLADRSSFPAIANLW